MIKILYEDNHLLVVEKPINVPVMEDDSKDMDFLTLCKQDIKVRYNKPGEVYLGLVHRLDRPVGGVMVFAKTSKAAARLSKQVQERTMVKIYQAVVLGTLQKEALLQDYLVKDRRQNRVTVSTSKNKEAKYAELHYQVLQSKENLNWVEIQLKTGRSHQIRVQFSSHGHALWGDQRYNPTAKVGQQIALWATSLTLIHPITHESMTFKSDHPVSFPWSLFQ